MFITLTQIPLKNTISVRSDNIAVVKKQHEGAIITMTFGLTYNVEESFEYIMNTVDPGKVH